MSKKKKKFWTGIKRFTRGKRLKETEHGIKLSDLDYGSGNFKDNWLNYNS